MRIRISQLLEMLLVVSLVVPATMLYSVEQNPSSSPAMSVTQWADAHRANALFNNLQDMARKVRKEVAPIQVAETQIFWQAQASKLVRVENDVDTMGNDLMQLDAMKNELQPWQKQLLHRVTPNIHELVYQTDAAIKKLGAKQSALALISTQYPDNITMIADQTNHVIRSVGTFIHYQTAKAKLAGLIHQKASRSNS